MGVQDKRGSSSGGSSSSSSDDEGRKGWWTARLDDPSSQRRIAGYRDHAKQQQQKNTSRESDKDRDRVERVGGSKISKWMMRSVSAAQYHHTALVERAQVRSSKPLLRFEGNGARRFAVWCRTKQQKGCSFANECRGRWGTLDASSKSRKQEEGRGK